VHTGINAFDGFTPSVPNGETLDLGSEHFIELENAGGVQLTAAGD
jgi:hypothetical protein